MICNDFLKDAGRAKPLCLSYDNFRKMRRLVRQCCNYDDGYCIALDDGELCPCVQRISYSLLCKWFRTAVLPLDAALCAALAPPSSGITRRCRCCGQSFPAQKHNTLYCPTCAQERTKQSKREWARRKRGGM